MTVTKDQAQMLATLACATRPMGARQWKPDAVMAEIEKLRDRTLGSVICAVTRAAMDRNAQRPEVISSAGSHWSDTQTVVPQTEPVARGDRCSICSLPKNACELRWRHDHEFDSLIDAARRKAEGTPEAMAEVIAALKDEIAAADPREPAPRGLEDMAERNPKLKARVDAIRAVLPVPPMQEPEPEAVEA
jgi:hypothetical protein